MNRSTMNDSEQLHHRLMWAALLAGVGFAVSFVAEKAAEVIWRQVTGLEPPKN